MDREKLAFYQIHFKDEQKTEMYDFAIPYLNQVLTPYFENSVIAEVVPKCNADFVSVCSWRLRKKRGDMFRLQDKKLTKEKILNSDFDVAILTPRSPTHNVMGMASHWHGASWDNAIKDLRNFIKIPNVVKHAVYENHFVARGDIYRDYVNTFLLPVMDYMEGRDVYFVDSGYITRKKAEEVHEYQQKSGRKDWPIAPFVLERLFSIWINDKGFKVIPL
jgi:hypothetical protein